MFRNLGIRKKFLLLLVFILIITAVLISGLVAFQLKSNAENKIEEFRQEEVAKVKRGLKNYVDIAFETVDRNYRASKDKQYIEQQYGPRLTNIIDLAYAAIRENMELAEKGTITIEEAKSNATGAIKKMRYDNGTGYIWINDTGKPYPKMVMHPTVPALDGKVLDAAKFNCALGIKKNLFVAFVDVCEKDGEGFVDYLWPKPTKDGLTKEQPKLSYVRLVKEWNWIIGTGVYVDDALQDAIVKIKRDIKGMRYDAGVGYFWINDTGKPYPKMVMHPTLPALDGKVMDAPKFNCALGIKKNLFVAFVDVCEKDGEGFVDYLWQKPTKDGLTKEQPKLSYVREYGPLGWIIGTGVYIDDIDALILKKTDEIRQEVNRLISHIVLLISGIFFVFILTVYYLANKGLIRPLQKATKISTAIADGDLTQRIDEIGRDEIGQLGRSMNQMVEQLKTKGGYAEAIAAGDLRITPEVATDKDMLGKSLQAVVENLNRIVRNISNVSEQVAAGANQVNRSSQMLSEGAIQQAEALEEITSSMNKIGEQTKTNAEHANEANQLATSARDAGKSGVRQMEEMVGAMETIRASSTEINKIIKATDDIAFQTNLLALNAAVEAARADKHGKGFAVVAQEVRNLAARSAKAAQETAELIEAAVKKIEDGGIIAEKTATSLEEMNKGVSKVAELVAEIAAASSEQAQGIAHVNSGLSQIDTVTQQNTANAKETSYSAEDLSSLAAKSQDLLSQFKLKDQAASTRDTDEKLPDTH